MKTCAITEGFMTFYLLPEETLWVRGTFFFLDVAGLACSEQGPVCLLVILTLKCNRGDRGTCGWTYFYPNSIFSYINVRCTIPPTHTHCFSQAWHLAKESWLIWLCELKVDVTTFDGENIDV